LLLFVFGRPAACNEDSSRRAKSTIKDMVKPMPLIVAGKRGPYKKRQNVISD
jgi:hypothetical protein